MSSIVQEPNDVLRKKALPVPAEMIRTPEFMRIVERMKTALNREEDGVAIAAPQIGVSYRVFIVSKKSSKKFDEDMVFINPEIIRLGKQKDELSEGCLSVRWKYGLVKRSTTATVRALNSEGNEFVIQGRGLLAQIFQHEIDHLEGILFIDKARNVEDIPPELHEHKS
jgi:peptide deformylase